MITKNFTTGYWNHPCQDKMLMGMYGQSEEGEGLVPKSYKRTLKIIDKVHI